MKRTIDLYKPKSIKVNMACISKNNLWTVAEKKTIKVYEIKRLKPVLTSKLTLEKL